MNRERELELGSRDTAAHGGFLHSTLPPQARRQRAPGERLSRRDYIVADHIGRLVVRVDFELLKHRR